MPRIPRSEATVRTQIADQPTMPLSFGTAPGRALVGLGNSLSKIGNAFAGEADKEKDYNDKLTMLKWQNALDLENQNAVANYNLTTTDPNNWAAERGQRFGTAEQELRSKIQPRTKAEEYRLNYFIEQNRGRIGESNNRFRLGQLAEKKFSSINEAVAGLVGKLDPRDPAFESNFQAALGVTQKLVDEANLPPAVKRRLEKGALSNFEQMIAGLPPAQQLKMHEALKAAQGPEVDQDGAVVKGGAEQGPQKIELTPKQKSKLNGVREEVVDKFSRLQSVVGRQFNVNSGYRDPSHNARVGGARKSQHINRNAIDIDVRDVPKEERLKIIEAASALGFKGIGVYDNAIHVDIGSRRSWGSDYSSRTIPAWARGTIHRHLKGEFKANDQSFGTAASVASGEITKVVSPKEFFGSNVDVAKLPLGMRLSNNPGNIKFSGSDWQRKSFPGLMGPSEAKDQGDPQAKFANPLAGMVAAVRLARLKQSQGMSTVQDIIAGRMGWTPGFNGAAQAISKTMGISPTTQIDLNNDATMAKFMRALITQEHGNDGRLYSDDLIKKGIAAASGRADGAVAPMPGQTQSAQVNLRQELLKEFAPRLSGIRARMVKQIATEVSTVVERGQAGYLANPEELAALKSKVDEAKTPELTAAYASAVSFAQTASRQVQRPVAENEAIIAATRARFAQKTPSVAQLKELQAFETLVANQKKTIDKDPLKWAVRAGVVPETPFNPADPNAMQARMNAAVAAQERFGGKLTLLHEKEADDLSEQIKGGKSVLGIATTFVAAWGPENARRALSQISTKMPEAAIAGWLLTKGVNLQTAKDIDAAIKYRSDESYKPNLPSPNDYESTVREVFQGAYSTFPPEQRALMVKAALAVYEVRMKNNPTFSSSDFRKALTEVTGQRERDGVKYGGVLSQGYGWAGRQPIVVPPNWRQDKFKAVLNTITAAELQEAGIRIPFASLDDSVKFNGEDYVGEPINVPKLMNGRLYQVAEDKFLISMLPSSQDIKPGAEGFVDAAPGDPNAMPMPNGRSAFVLDLGKLEPILRRRLVNSKTGYSNYFWE